MTEETTMASASTLETNPGVELEKILHNVPDEYLQCRGMQHRWTVTAEMHIVEVGPDGDLVERHLQCDRCETIKHDRFLLRQDRWGVNRLEVLGRVYTYPEDYLIPAMQAADHAREILRYEQLVRSLGGKGAVNRALKKAASAAS